MFRTAGTLDVFCSLRSGIILRNRNYFELDASSHSCVLETVMFFVLGKAVTIIHVSFSLIKITLNIASFVSGFYVSILIVK